MSTDAEAGRIDQKPRLGRKLTKTEKSALSPIEQAYIEKGGLWIWMENSP